MEDSFEARFHLAVQKRCSKLYGDSIPKQVLDRIAVEWAVLQDKYWLLLFEALTVIADISRENGCCFRIHGAVESSLIAYLLGLTKADPLPVHYLCPHCKRVEFITDGSVKCAPDLSERICPVCGTNLNRSGFDLQLDFPFARDRIWPLAEAAIDGSCIKEICNRLEDKFGAVNRPSFDLRTHICDFDKESRTRIILESNGDAETAKRFRLRTGIDMCEIPLCGDEGMKKILPFIKTEINRVLPACEDSLSAVLSFITPSCFGDLIRICGLALAEGAWQDNGKELIRDGVATLNEIITCRDDVYSRMLQVGFTPEDAYRITDVVRKGRWQYKGNARIEQYRSDLQDKGIPEWYIGSMEKISYLVPRSVCVRYALAAYRSAWISNNYLPTIIPEGIETVRGALLSPFATDG